MGKSREPSLLLRLCWRLLIFPGRRQPSIFSVSELNFRVRDGNGCTLATISANSFFIRPGFLPRLLRLENPVALPRGLPRNNLFYSPRLF